MVIGLFSEPSLTAILDNTSFAGVMRKYAPDLEPHREFCQRFPYHTEIDDLSLADLLTALCTFDQVLLESSSVSSHVNSGDVQQIPNSDAGSWVDQLLELLPKDVASVIYAAPLIDREMVLGADDRAIHLAIDLFNSELRERIRLKPGEKLPNVYTSPSYKYRDDFLRINKQQERPLSDELLSQAMFLHRGLYLQSCAIDQSVVYLPYLYRGRMLSSLPPLITLVRPALIPLSKDRRPEGKDSLKELNKFYFDLVEKLTWTSYDESVPFIGAAILARARGSVRAAFDIALELREKGEIRKDFRWMHQWIREGDRVLYDIAVSEIKASLTKAYHSLGGGTNPKLETLYRLSTFWMPDEGKKILDAALDFIPHRIRHKASEFASKLLTKNSIQLLFQDHIKALRR